ncbi:MAG: phosphoribosylglycinamide formyltransferase [Gammaproteobacteria bacterium]|nr:phosphoribosylglycinamide formyltransferase [Gammaproteobacteria bacterium]
MNTPLSLVVLISGNGSNLQALLDAIADGRMQARIAAVISNRPDAFGLERAKAAGIATAVLDHKAYTDRDSYDAALAALIADYRPDLVILAGFMRILTPALIQRFAGRMLNIHPSLLPKYPGLHTHRRALEAGEAEHGCTIHTVTAELDGGPILAQASCPIETGDDEASLAAKVRVLEHRLYPEVIQGFAEGRFPL